MKRIGVFPGSFDPFTKGHEDIVKRYIPLVDEIIVAVGVNTNKKYMFTQESRTNHIKSLFNNDPTVRVESFEGLTVDFCRKNKAQYLLRGIRNAIDADYERSIAQMNFELSGIETLFLMCAANLAPISSSIVREIKRSDGDISSFVTNEELLIIN
jgi:pantetheine-phosphate adenylyltransferase